MLSLLRRLVGALELQAALMSRQIALYEQRDRDARRRGEEDRKQTAAYIASQQRSVDINEEILRQNREHIERCDAAHRRLLDEKAETLQ